MLAVLALVLGLNGERRDSAKGTKVSKGRRNLLHKGEKNTRRIETLLWYIMDQQAKLPDFYTWGCGWASQGLKGRQRSLGLTGGGSAAKYHQMAA